MLNEAYLVMNSQHVKGYYSIMVNTCEILESLALDKHYFTRIKLATAR